MKDQTYIFVHVDPALKVTVKRLAKADGRTTSSLVRKLILDYVAAQPKPTERKKP